MMKKRKCVILVVEDEAITLLDAEATIREAGFDVAVAANADEAIRILESRGRCMPGVQRHRYAPRIDKRCRFSAASGQALAYGACNTDLGATALRLR